MSLAYTILSFLVALGVLIVVHELGHYYVARLCDVKVLRFSVGFGRPLFVRRVGRDETEWVIATMPIGGYVKMVDEREGPVAPADRPRAFNRQSVWRRFAIVAAGPTANLLFAILLYWVLFLSGVQEATPIVAPPPPGTPAAQAGLIGGETIRAINGEPIKSWQDVQWRLLQLAVDHQRARLEVTNENNALDWRTLDLSAVDTHDMEGDLLGKLGLRLYRPPVIGVLVSGTVAERAGLQVGDRVVAIGATPIDSWEALVSKVRANPGVPLTFEIVRDGATLRVEISPETVIQSGTPFGRIGAGPPVVEIRYGVAEAFAKSCAKTWETSLFSLRMFGKMIVGEVSWRNLSGPLTIADYAGQSAQLGLAPYLAFLALISISLAVLNLLPIPLLDGGHLMYYTIEILKGSPVSDRIMEAGQRAGLVVLLFLIAFAFYNDITRLFSG